jgi:SAM-dependent methyltransferase
MAKNFLSRRSKLIFDRLKIEDMAVTANRLEHWLNSDFGRYLLHQESQLLQRKYSHLPGYRLMHLGLGPHQQTLDTFKQLHRFYIHANADSPAAPLSAASNYAQLPLPSEVIDVALVQHAVEYSVSPKAVLAEVSRVVAPGGHLLLCLFNPYGPRGLIKFPMQLFSGRPDYRFHNLRKGRVIDWLSLLNFQVLEIDHGAYNLPLNRPEWTQADTHWEKIAQKIRFPLGNFYMIHAVKRELRGIGTRAHLWRPAATNGYSSGGGKPSRKKAQPQNAQKLPAKE